MKVRPQLPAVVLCLATYTADDPMLRAAILVETKFDR